MILAMKKMFATLREIISLESRVITLSGDAKARLVFNNFVRQHPRYPVIRHKTLGVALLELPGSFSTYLQAPARKDLRNKRNRALRLGYRFAAVRSLEYRNDILLVNQSSQCRQGGAMPDSYILPEKVDEFIRNHPDCHAVLDAAGRLRAYLLVLPLGEVGVISRILGHDAFLKDGIMALLVSGMVNELVSTAANVKYLMYDMYFGATPGLRHFKRHLGFVPFRVKWRWREADGAGG